MFKAVSPLTLGVAWAVALVAIALTAAFAGLSWTAGIGTLWFAACVVPPAVMLLVWRGAPPPTMAEILHAVDKKD